MATQKQIEERIKKRDDETSELRKQLRKMKERDKRSKIRAQNTALGKELSERFAIKNIMTETERHNLINEIIQRWNAYRPPENNG